MKTKNIAIVFGGFSGERVISEKSANVVLSHLPKELYQAYLVDIDEHDWLAVAGDKKIKVNKDDFTFMLDGVNVKFDGVFNAIHGTPGEDGKIQGYFDMLGIPYNNCGVLASALSFNKIACNAYLSARGIKVAKSVVIHHSDFYDEAQIIAELGLPLFVKPASSGSSLGVTKVKEQGQFQEAVKLAKAHMGDVLVESFLDGMEVSCGCITKNGIPEAVAVTEIVPANEFFDFESKYTNKATREIVPARMSQAKYDEIMRLTERIYRILDCKGMIRIDFMVCDDAIYLIEPNTTPGLSEASILPQQAKFRGYTLGEFFDLSLTEMFSLAKPENSLS